MGFFPRWTFPGGDVKVPQPPKLPEYDINEEAPKWNWTRLWYTLDPIVPDPETPKTGGVPKSDDKPDWRGVIKENIIPMTPPEPYEFGNFGPKNYFWFDTPDYADPMKKMRYAFLSITKFGIASSAIYAMFTGLEFNRESHRLLFNRIFSRIWLGGMTASLGVMTIANLRGCVDDYWNYAISGYIAGAVVGRKHPLSFLRQTFMWTIASVAVKWNAETNGKLLPMLDFRGKNHSMALGSGAEYGFWSGDLRPSFYKIFPDDPGRMPRTYPAA